MFNDPAAYPWGHPEAVDSKRNHGWYVKPFHIVAWVDEQGRIRDSVSYKGLNRDMIAFE
jgi:hypothetical protein